MEVSSKCSHCGAEGQGDLVLCAKCESELERQKARLEQSFTGNAQVASAADELLDALGVDKNDQNYRNTPNRYARAFVERNRRCFDGDEEERINGLLGRTFEHNSDDFVIVDNIRAISSCAHHLESVIFRVHFGYVPNGKVVGLSKIPRLVKYLAKKPTLQEAYAEELADTFHEQVEPQSTLVHVAGRHGCMADRGVEAHESNMTVTALRGESRENKSQVDEFYQRLDADHDL